MTSVMVYPYRAGSNSARDLARELGVRRISHTNSRFRGREDKVIINWGASRLPEEVAKCTIINNPQNVRNASNKLTFFERIQFVNNEPHDDSCRIPEFTANYNEAIEWTGHGDTVVCRRVLNGHSGEGIVIMTRENYMDVHHEHGLTSIPLFVKYVKKRQEYRVHVFRGEVLDVQRKARSRDVPDDQVNWQVRNHTNGFIFSRNGEALGDVPQDVMDQAVNAVNICGLDFGAVDVVFNDQQQQAYVLEVNTSPGLTGTTLTNYAQAFRGLIND